MSIMENAIIAGGAVPLIAVLKSLYSKLKLAWIVQFYDHVTIIWKPV